MSTLKIGSVLLGKYRLERVMVRGWASTIFGAWELETERPVAIKVLRGDANPLVEFERFLTEGRRASLITSEHIVEVLDIGVLEAGEPFLVMEYLEGADLSQLTRYSEKMMEVETAVEYALQALEGLAEAHARGMLHRDLEPSHIFLTKRADGTPLVKLLGFAGLKFHAAYDETEAATLTSEGSRLTHCRAPEQLNSGQEIDERVDIWAFGIVLFQLLTGAKPFKGETPAESVLNMLGAQPISPSTLRPTLPKALDAVVLRCLEKSPDSRFRNVAELAAALYPFAPPRARPSVSRIAHVRGVPVPLNLQSPQRYRLPWLEPLARPAGQETTHDEAKSEDDLLRRLTITARDEMLDDPRWEALAAGTLPERDAQELHALAERSDSARKGFELFRPLTPEERSAMAERVISKITTARAAPRPETWRRTLLVPLAAATSVAIAAVIGRLVIVPHSGSAPVPLYELIVFGGIPGGMVFMALQASRLVRRLKAVEAENKAAREENSRLEAGNRLLIAKFDEAANESRKVTSWLDHMDAEIGWLRSELEKRPKVTRKTYKVVTLGIKWAGKTSLTLKWANPLTDLGAIEGTKSERYERLVSRVLQKDITIEYVFEIHDWAGEHIVDAQQELIMEEIHGLLMVVDLGVGDTRKVDPQRIQDQLREFQTAALRYFFSPRTMASCKAVVLFINKSDLIPGTAAEVEEQARRLYAPLIDDLMAYSTKIDVRILVGSASHGRSTQQLFTHLVEKIIPKNAYDTQLLQRMKASSEDQSQDPAAPSAAAVEPTDIPVAQGGTPKTVN